MWAGIAMVATLTAYAYVTQIGVAQELIAQEKLRLSDPPTNRLASQLHQFACGMHQ